MNGYWTAPTSFELLKGAYYKIGTFCDTSFGDLTERCRELNISELELGHIPKSMVREFTSGKCVMVKFASRPGFAMIQISEFLKEPPPHPGYEPPAQPQ